MNNNLLILMLVVIIWMILDHFLFVRYIRKVNSLDKILFSYLAQLRDLDNKLESWEEMSNDEVQILEKEQHHIQNLIDIHLIKYDSL